MYYLCYKSVVSNSCTPEQVLEILPHSRAYNIQKAITGMLLHVDPYFIQIIEGDKKEVKDLYLKIVGDKRHTQIKVLSEGFQKERFFANWVMGFQALTQQDIEEIALLNQIQGLSIEELLNESKPHIATEFLKAFYTHGQLDYQKFWKDL